MISPIRSLCFNDDRETFTVVYPTMYQVFRCSPFSLVFRRECEDLSFGGVSSFNGRRFVALNGSASSHHFTGKSIRVFDHDTGEIVFDRDLSDFVLSMCVGRDMVVAAMHGRVEIFSTITGKAIHGLNTGKNVHIPLAISKDSNMLVIPGDSDKQLCLIRGLKSEPQTTQFVADDRPVSLAKFSDDANLLATLGFQGNMVRICDTKGITLLAVLNCNLKPDDIVLDFDFAPLNDFFAIATRAGDVKIFDIRNRKPDNIKPINPQFEGNVGHPVNLPKIIFNTSNVLSFISLDGEYNRINVIRGNLDFEKIPFTHRKV